MGRTFFSRCLADESFKVCLGVAIAFWCQSDELINRPGVNINVVVRMVYADAWMAKPAVPSRTCQRKCSGPMFDKGTLGKD